MNTEIMKTTLFCILITLAFLPRGFASDKDEPETAKSDKTNHGEKGIFAGARDFNLSKNPGFENRTSTWLLGKYNGGSGLFTTDTIKPLHGRQSALVVTDNSGKEYNDVQLFTFFNLLKGSAYEIIFEADVQSNCKISITVSNGFETFYEVRLALQPGKKQYGPFKFIGKQDDQFSYFSFNLGKTKAEIRFDEVIIRADHSEREFDEMISRSGINFHYDQDKSMVCISAPTEAQSDLPILLYDQNNNIINTYKIRKGSKEANITFNMEMDKGNYLLKVFTRDEQEAFHFSIL